LKINKKERAKDSGSLVEEGGKKRRKRVLKIRGKREKPQKKG